MRHRLRAGFLRLRGTPLGHYLLPEMMRILQATGAVVRALLAVGVAVAWFCTPYAGATIPGKEAAAENTAEAEIQRGSEAQDRGDHAAAITNFTRAIHLRPDYAMAYVNRGVSYGALGQASEAMQDFDKAIALDPKCASAYFNRAAAYSRQGDTKAALRDYETAVRLKPDFAEALYNLARLYERTGNPSDARIYYQRFIEAAPPTYSNRVGIAKDALERLNPRKP
jgi:tetratricopeptide (TPR) repeat protein